MIKSFIAAAIAAILVSVLADPAGAVQIVVPPIYAATEGQIAAGSILSNTVQSNEAQYAAAQLSGVPIGSQIIGLYWRMNRGSATPSSAMSFADFDIYLGQAAHSITTMTGTFENNLLNPVQVRDGALSIAQGVFPGGSTPTPLVLSYRSRLLIPTLVATSSCWSHIARTELAA